MLGSFFTRLPHPRLVRFRAWFFILLAGLGYVSLIVVELLGDPQNIAAPLLAVKTFLTGTQLLRILEFLHPFTTNSIVSGVVIGFLTWIGTYSIIQIFKLPGIRNNAIRGIAYGYCENFLRKLIQHASTQHAVYRIIIVMPRFELVTHPEVYWHSLQMEIARLGFTTETTKTDQAFGRSTFVISKKSEPALPIYVDVPTTVRVLQELLELEADMPIGRGKDRGWFRARFTQMRHEFAQAVRDYYPEDALPHLVFITPQSDVQFRAEIHQAIEQLETDIAAYSAEMKPKDEQDSSAP